MTSVNRLQDLPIQQYLERSCLHFYASDLLRCVCLTCLTADTSLQKSKLKIPERFCRLLSQEEAANGGALACSYFCAVAKGQHVVGRDFTYISLTLWNRQSFLHAAKAIFEQTTRYCYQKDNCQCALLCDSNALSGSLLYTCQCTQRGLYMHAP